MDVGRGGGASRTIVCGGWCSRSTNPNPEAIGMVSFYDYTRQNLVTGLLSYSIQNTPGSSPMLLFAERATG